MRTRRRARDHYTVHVGDSSGDTPLEESVEIGDDDGEEPSPGPLRYGFFLTNSWGPRGAFSRSTCHRGNVYHVKNSLRGGDADIVTTYGRVGDEVYVGDWDGNGTDTIGVRRTPETEAAG